MSWLITPAQRTDPDALAYLAEVERADGQALESGVRDAVIAFVTGCKADGIWTAIKASCILAGARTRIGALTPLSGAAPTSFNFVDADYNRETGLKGNASNKYLNSNRADNADPLNSFHMSGYITTTALAGTNEFLMGGVTTPSNLGSYIFNSSGNLRATIKATATDTFNIAGVGGSTGFMGGSRSGATASSFRVGQTNYTSSQSSTTAAIHNNFVFCRSVNGVPASFTNARLAFYSIGESIDLALLDARVTTLINAFAAAIP